ncbi:LysM peptidoglycan-binding domain-containing protein [Bacillus sp. DJP31]|uniref:LysM peptidoglycan-binding domain-containing protein n=1 Tax=Bacillus sp. DJP31 TaxID=3409789 RepID=UPI003BB76A52
MDIQRYNLVQDGYEFTLEIYIGGFHEEFASELGHPLKNQQVLVNEARRMAKENYPNIKIKTIKILAGVMLLSVINMGDFRSTVARAASTPTYQIAKGYPIVSHTVKSGDSLSFIARKYQVTTTDIKVFNGLKTDMIYIGQIIKIPLYSYVVMSGDSMYAIAKKLNTTVTIIKEANNLTTDRLSIGQKLLIPITKTTTTAITPLQPAPVISATAQYIVKSGDTLNQIARNHGTTTQEIQRLNALTTTTIFPGQILKMPTTVATPAPAPTLKPNTYIIVSGDSLFSLAKKFTVTVDSLKSTNNLTTDLIFVGQQLLIPEQVVSVDQTSPASPIVSSLDTILQTNVASYLLIGSAEPQAKVVITATDGANVTITQEVIANDEGVFTLKSDFTTLQDGPISIEASATDQAGNKSPTTKQTLTKDTVGPGKPTVSVPSFINASNQHEITLTGQTEPGSLVKVSITDNSHTINKQATSDATGNFSVKVDARMLNEGPITVEAKTFDSLGNEGEVTTNQSTKDVSVGNLVLSDSPAISAELAAAYTINGSGEPNTSINLSISDIQGTIVTKEAQSDVNGSFEAVVDTTTLQDGTLTMLIYQRDAAGNQSNTVTKLVKKDTTSPDAVVIDELNMLQQNNATTYFFSGKGEPLSTVKGTFKDSTGNVVTLEAKVRVDGTFSLQTDLSSFSGDTLTMTAHQVDDVGNESPVTTVSTTIDTIGPKSLDMDFAPIINMESVDEYTLTGVTEPHASLELELTDGTSTIIQTVKANEEGHFALTANASKLKDGRITGRVLTEDIHENKGVTKEISIVKDTLVTIVSSLEVGDSGKVSSFNVDAYSIQGLSQEEGAIVKIEITDGVSIVKESALVVDGRYHIPMNLSNLAEGELQVSVTQKDIAGNDSQPITQSIQKDTKITQPVVQMSKLTRTPTGYVYNINGIGELQSTIIINISGQSSQANITKSYQINISESFNSTIDITSLNGQKPFITVQQVDSFGNKSKPQITGISSYVVGSGDTLWKVSTLLGTTVQELKSLNNLSTDMVFIGQELKVPLVAGLEHTAVSETTSFNMGYLYHGSSNSFMETMKHTQGSINVVSPTYFDINPDGSLKLTKVVDRYFIANMQSSGIRVVPFLSNHWERAVGEKALENRVVLTDQIAEAVEIYNLDGVNIDIENVTHEYQDEYTEFAKMLRKKIPADKEVSVAVAANPNGFKTGWHGSYDYTNLASSSDYLMVMAYDESYAGSAPGPIASIDFVEKSIQYAINNGVPKNKIVLGIGHYGRYWKEGSSVGGYGISNEQVMQAINMYNGHVTFDQASKSPKATFTIKPGDPALTVSGEIVEPGNYTIWFENEESIQAKYELVSKYGIKGTGNWGLEQENPEFWSTFSGWVKPSEIVSGEGPG